MGYFPIFIDLNKFKALVIGGGEVATRKVLNLLEFDHKPKVIAPEFAPELEAIIAQFNLDCVRRKYQKGDLAGYNLIFVATDDKEVDTLIKKEADKIGAIVNFADKPELCDFIVPSFIKRGDLVISISTQGKVPFLSRYFREILEKKVPKGMKDYVEISAYFRSKLKELAVPKKLKDEIIEEFLSVKWIEIIEDDGIEYAKLLVNHLIDYYANKQR
ncbi:MAG: bifunctional precorrin-2 dehydrogenase/sirohydrochlorin ferrochelatase [Ignavibacteria bacterium]|nr:bifunctional precorrin-2 dehydrogenase/sirohydrochlorin ferrochelatase [Ignavibacteria bacterium]